MQSCYPSEIAELECTYILSEKNWAFLALIRLYLCYGHSNSGNTLKWNAPIIEVICLVSADIGKNDIKAI